MTANALIIAIQLFCLNLILFGIGNGIIEALEDIGTFVPCNIIEN